MAAKNGGKSESTAKKIGESANRSERHRYRRKISKTAAKSETGGYGIRRGKNKLKTRQKRSARRGGGGSQRGGCNRKAAAWQLRRKWRSSERRK